MNYKDLVQEVYPGANCIRLCSMNEYIIRDGEFYCIGKKWMPSENKAWKEAWEIVQEKMIRKLEL